MAFPGLGANSYSERLWHVVQAEARRLRSIRHVPSGWLTGHYVSTDDPIVVAGCGRSGTTLMSVILNSHSDIYCGPEDSLLLEWDFTIDQIAVNYGYDPRWLLKKARCFYNHGAFTEFLMRDQKQRRNVSKFATKQPRYALCLPALLQRFPSARVIYLCRDGRDVAFSFRKNERHMGVWPDVKHDETGMLSMKYCAEVWRMFVNAYSPFENDRRCKYVCYERLCTRPREVLKDLCSFLGMPFEESMLAFYKGAADRDDLNLPHLVKTKSPLASDHLGQWKKELTPAQVQEFEKYAGRELVHTGYELSTSSSPEQQRASAVQE
jgi:hypothetical protein